jgi:DNA-binding CsgD family transcriptional regulator
MNQPLGARAGTIHVPQLEEVERVGSTCPSSWRTVACGPALRSRVWRSVTRRSATSSPPAASWALRTRPFTRQAATELGALGEPVARHLGRRAAFEPRNGGLTRRQIEVLRLVAVGRTNREIAAEVFLSTRTMDMHVRNILAQLACRSRAEATARTRFRGTSSKREVGATRASCAGAGGRSAATGEQHRGVLNP